MEVHARTAEYATLILLPYYEFDDDGKNCLPFCPNLSFLDGNILVGSIPTNNTHPTHTLAQGLQPNNGHFSKARPESSLQHTNQPIHSSLIHHDEVYSLRHCLFIDVLCCDVALLVATIGASLVVFHENNYEHVGV